MVAPILVVLLFGIIELGLIFKDMMTLNQAAREGGRVAAVGSSTTEIVDRLQSAAASLRPESLSYTLQYRTYSGGTWGEWMTLGDTSAEGYTTNDAPQGAQIRVLANYTHQLVTGGLFSSLADDPEANTVDLQASLIIRRE